MEIQSIPNSQTSDFLQLTPPHKIWQSHPLEHGISCDASSCHSLSQVLSPMALACFLCCCSKSSECKVPRFMRILPMRGQRTAHVGSAAGLPGMYMYMYIITITITIIIIIINNIIITISIIMKTST